nr:alpha/beta hydrolase [uncultured Devosia sp.]
MFDPTAPTIPEVTHHHLALENAELHYVSAGAAGSPILLVHGFPETWWAFHKLIPLLARNHRVLAVDLPGFGDSGLGDGDLSSTVAAASLHDLIAHLGLGPVHLVAQDISGGAAFRLATSHPEDVASFTAVEMGLAGFGLEGLADITHGGSWHIGVLAAPAIPELLLAGTERDFIAWMFRTMTALPGAVTDADIDEFARTYARPHGWRGASGLYRSMLAEGAELQAIAQRSGLTMPVLAIGAGGGDFTKATMAAVADDPKSVQLEGVGHYASLEAPDRVAAAILDFID